MNDTPSFILQISSLTIIHIVSYLHLIPITFNKILIFLQTKYKNLLYSLFNKSLINRNIFIDTTYIIVSPKASEFFKLD